VLLWSSTVVALAFFATQASTYAIATRPGSLPGVPWLVWLGTTAWLLGVTPLVFEIVDDGPGFDPSATSGSGLQGMADRLAAVVRGRVPLPA
jgi:hypothetical protein